MANPQFLEQKPISLVEVKASLEAMEKRDSQLNYLSNKAKELLENFVTLSLHKKDELQKKLQELNLTRIREEHIAKIIDFLPKDSEELKVILQAYPLSLPKKDQDDILRVVADFRK